MKTYKSLKYVALSSLLLVSTSCSFFEVDDTTDPNRPSIEVFQQNATVAQLNLLANGVVAQFRNSYATNAPYYQVLGTFGRELYNMNDSEPRWLTELLGDLNLELDNAAFYSTAAYNQIFITTRAARNLILSADASPNVTEEQKQGIRGFANTMQALSMLHALNLMGSNGIRIDLADPYKPGPFVSYEAALTEIRRLLDLGATQLAAGGASFVMNLPSGFDGFDTPAGFLKFNKAITARVAVYQKDWNGALTALQSSFFNLGAASQEALDYGPQIQFSPTSPDIANPFYQVANSTAASVIYAHPSFITDAEPNDKRLKKVALSTNPKTSSGQTGTYQSVMYASNESPISIIENEELILIYAEAQIQLGNLAEGQGALNTIRTVAGGLPEKTALMTQAELIDEMLKQRRYSLWYQGHRLVDMRRYNRLNTLPKDEPEHDVYAQLRKPQAEEAWDQYVNNR